MFRTLTPTLALIVALLIFFVVIQPQYAQLSRVQQDILNYTNAAADYQRFADKISELEARRNQISVVERGRLDTLVPREIDVTQALVDLEGIAERNLMLFGNIALAGGTDDEAYEEEVAVDEYGQPIPMPLQPDHADISFEVIGTYAQFKSFLAELEQSLTLFEVISLNVDITEGDFQQFAVTVRTYALPVVTQP